MRYFYSGLLYLALPYLFLRLWWRSLRFPMYRKRLGERLGHYPQHLKNCIWVHAVSVGEVMAAIPMIKALKIHNPNVPLLVTTMTPTGATQVKKAFGNHVVHAYIPYDFPHAVKNFLDAMQPRVGIIMETELWPNLLAACAARQIPICLMNARLSAKSAKGYRIISSLMREMLQPLKVIAAHGPADARRFINLGAREEQVIVTGNIKFDLKLPADLGVKSQELHEKLGLERVIWIAASTHEGEEEKILHAHKKLREVNPRALLILVPRHPDRFDAVAKLVTQQGMALVRRSQQTACTSATDVYLGDTMGELLLMYAVADVAFVGGSLVATGGHNMLEPAALAKPILAGPYLFNFTYISELLLDANAMIITKDKNVLAEELIRLIQNTDVRVHMGMRAQGVVYANRGALQRQLDIVDQVVADNVR